MFYLGLLLFCATHLLFLGKAPGFHFDEAWAAEHSLRIAFETGFWPLKAMTVQTSPWSHYVTAAFFKIFSPSVFVYRASYAFLNLAALLLFVRGLKNFSFPKAANMLPWVAALVPALVMNHRFSIEITAFHSLCFALIFYSVSCFKLGESRFAWVGIFAGAFLGFTSHVFFLGALSALLWLLLVNERKYVEQKSFRIFLTTLILSLLPFVYSISSEIVWKWKGRALLTLFVVLLVWVLAFRGRSPKFTPKFNWVVYALALPFAFNFLLFFESHWIVLHHFGKISVPFIVGLQFLISLTLAVMYWRSEGKSIPELRSLIKYLVALLACGGVVMITQAPRYYEIPFWLVTIFLSFALVWAWQQNLRFKILVATWALTASGTLAVNYYQPGKYEQGISNDFAVLLLKESSFDYTPKDCNMVVDPSDQRKQFTQSILKKLNCP